jgi:NADH:ubiquinone oxidoreductase subunit H
MPLFWFASKVGAILFLYMGARHAPAFSLRSTDAFAWTVLFPVAIINLFVTGLAVALESR